MRPRACSRSGDRTATRIVQAQRRRLRQIARTSPSTVGSAPVGRSTISARRATSPGPVFLPLEGLAPRGEAGTAPGREGPREHLHEGARPRRDRSAPRARLPETRRLFAEGEPRRLRESELARLQMRRLRRSSSGSVSVISVRAPGNATSTARSTRPGGRRGAPTARRRSLAARRSRTRRVADRRRTASTTVAAGRAGSSTTAAPAADRPPAEEGRGPGERLPEAASQPRSRRQVTINTRPIATRARST